MRDDDYAINRVEWLEPIWDRLKLRLFGSARSTDAPAEATKEARPTGVGGLDWGDRGIYKDPYRG